MSVLMRVILCRDMDEGVKQIYRGIFIPSPFSTALTVSAFPPAG